MTEIKEQFNQIYNDLIKTINDNKNCVKISPEKIEILVLKLEALFYYSDIGNLYIYHKVLENNHHIKHIEEENKKATIIYISAFKERNKLFEYKNSYCSPRLKLSEDELNLLFSKYNIIQCNDISEDFIALERKALTDYEKELDKAINPIKTYPWFTYFKILSNEDNIIQTYDDELIKLTGNYTFTIKEFYKNPKLKNLFNLDTVKKQEEYRSTNEYIRNEIFKLTALKIYNTTENIDLAKDFINRVNTKYPFITTDKVGAHFLYNENERERK